MKLAVEQSCATCDAFLVNKDLQVKLGQPRQGWCRANPPVLVQTMVPVQTIRGTEMAPGFQGVFAPTASDCWCRQHRPLLAAARIIEHEDTPDAANKPAA
jgi:hypothetical protein